MYGKCIGVVKNSFPIAIPWSSDNCQVTHKNWDYQLYQFENYKPEIDIVAEYLTVQGMQLKGIIMTAVQKTATIGKLPSHHMA